MNSSENMRGTTSSYTLTTGNISLNLSFALFQDGSSISRTSILFVEGLLRMIPPRLNSRIVVHFKNNRMECRSIIHEEFPVQPFRKLLDIQWHALNYLFNASGYKAEGIHRRKIARTLGTTSICTFLPQTTSICS